MGATRSRGVRWRRSKSSRKPQKTSKRLRPSQPEPIDHDESGEIEETDRLLLSALRYWEVERDLIEERMAAVRPVSVRL
jgi:hypothetical protein